MFINRLFQPWIYDLERIKQSDSITNEKINHLASTYNLDKNFMLLCFETIRQFCTSYFYSRISGRLVHECILLGADPTSSVAYVSNILGVSRQNVIHSWNSYTYTGTNYANIISADHFSLMCLYSSIRGNEDALRTFEELYDEQKNTKDLFNRFRSYYACNLNSIIDQATVKFLDQLREDFINGWLQRVDTETHPHFLDLIYKYPRIFMYWHPDKNAVPIPTLFALTEEKYWWQCSTCGFEWHGKITSVTKIKSICKECRKEVFIDNNYFKSESSSMRTYTENLNNHRMLTQEELVDLFHIREHGANIEEEAFLGTWRLVPAIVRRYSRRARGTSIMDLIQEGNLGLLDAIERYDHKLEKASFATYAYFWIRQKIARYITNTQTTIRLPSHVSGHITRMNKYMREHQQTDLLDYTRMAEYVNDTSITLNEGRATPKSLRHIQLLLEPLVNIEDVDPNVFAFGDGTENSIFHKDLRTQVTRILEVLTDKEKNILILRFGLSGLRSHTLEEIGKEMGVTRERIRQIETKALNKIRNSKNINILCEYVEPKYIEACLMHTTGMLDVQNAESEDKKLTKENEMNQLRKTLSRIKRDFTTKSFYPSDSIKHLVLESIERAIKSNMPKSYACAKVCTEYHLQYKMVFRDHTYYKRCLEEQENKND